MDPSHYSSQHIYSGPSVRRAYRKKISWDEATITEHDKARGTREKIFEPKTPYYFSTSEHSSDNENLGDTKNECNREMGNIAPKMIMQQVSYKLNQLQHYTDFSDVSERDIIKFNENNKSSDDSKMNFKERRKKHYDEFFRIKNGKISDDEL